MPRSTAQDLINSGALALAILTSSHDIYQRFTTATIEYDTGIELSGD
jgi:hypothetical protein